MEPVISPKPGKLLFPSWWEQKGEKIKACVDICSSSSNAEKIIVIPPATPRFLYDGPIEVIIAPNSSVPLQILFKKPRVSETDYAWEDFQDTLFIFTKYARIDVPLRAVKKGKKIVPEKLHPPAEALVEPETPPARFFVVSPSTDPLQEGKETDSQELLLPRRPAPQHRHRMQPRPRVKPGVRLTPLRPTSSEKVQRQMKPRSHGPGAQAETPMKHGRGAPTPSAHTPIPPSSAGAPAAGPHRPSTVTSTASAPAATPSQPIVRLDSPEATQSVILLLRRRLKSSRSERPRSAASAAPSTTAAPPPNQNPSRPPSRGVFGPSRSQSVDIEYTDWVKLQEEAVERAEYQRKYGVVLPGHKGKRAPTHQHPKPLLHGQQQGPLNPKAGKPLLHQTPDATTPKPLSVPVPKRAPKPTTAAPVNQEPFDPPPVFDDMNDLGMSAYGDEEM